MIISTLRWLLLAVALVAPSVQAEQAIPDLKARVTDVTHTLSPEQEVRIEQMLSAFEARKGSQLAVLIIPTTAPEAIEPYALRVVEKWKIGRKNVDDGALLLVAKNDRSLRIEVGYGLEGALPDAVCKRIIDEVIVPRLQQQDFAGGIEAGLGKMMAVIEGEPLPPPSALARDVVGNSLQGFLPQLIVVAVILGLFLRLFLGLLTSSLTTGLIVTLLAWWLLGAWFTAMMAGLFSVLITLGVGRGLMSRGGGGGGRGGGSGGGGGSSGGGGGFGGGGASGKW